MEYMNIDEIISRRTELEKQLRFALSTMEKKDAIYNIKEKLIEVQRQCPHFSDKYNWVAQNGTCPYCGFHF